MKYQYLHFLLLIIVLICGLGFFVTAKGNPSFQLLIGMVTAVFYVLWGIIHHAVIGDLHPKVVIEYMLIGGIAIVLLMTIMQ